LLTTSRQTVVSPIIDVISDEDFRYLQGSETTYGGFSEKMIFRWIPMPEREHRRRGGDKSKAARFVFEHAENARSN
jgi:polypeptide N-acetylgalactosaminyltransferase